MASNRNRPTTTSLLYVASSLFTRTDGRQVFHGILENNAHVQVFLNTEHGETEAEFEHLIIPSTFLLITSYGYQPSTSDEQCDRIYANKNTVVSFKH